jgi:hypothetical protein
MINALYGAITVAKEIDLEEGGLLIVVPDVRKV